MTDIGGTGGPEHRPPAPDAGAGAGAAGPDAGAAGTGYGAGGGAASAAAGAASAAPRRLVRRDEGRLLGGVAGGLSDYFALDVRVVRLAFVLLALFGGFAVAAYLVAWLVLPSAAGGESPAERVLRGDGRSVAVAAVAALALFLFFGGVVAVGPFGLFDGPGPFGPFGDGYSGRFPGPWFGGTLPFALLLLLVGFLLFRDDGRRQAAQVNAAATTAPAAATSAAPSAAARPRSILGRATVALVLLAVGLAAALDVADVVALPPARYFALSLAIVGGGLVVGAWRGRSRGLILLGLALVPPLLFTSSVPAAFDGAVGEQVFRPARVEDVRESYRHAFGSFTLDLRGVAFPRERVTEVDVAMGFGELLVLLPADVTAHIEGRVRGGAVSIEDRSGREVGAASAGADGAFAGAGADRGDRFGDRFGDRGDGFGDRGDGFGDRGDGFGDLGPKFRGERFRDEGRRFRGDDRLDTTLPAGADAAEIALTIDAGFGEVTIVRAAAR